MSSYCANNPEKCDEYAIEIFEAEFDNLSPKEREYICDICNDDRIAGYDREYDEYKDRNI